MGLEFPCSWVIIRGRAARVLGIEIAYMLYCSLYSQVNPLLTYWLYVSRQLAHTNPSTQAPLSATPNQTTCGINSSSPSDQNQSLHLNQPAVSCLSRRLDSLRLAFSTGTDIETGSRNQINFSSFSAHPGTLSIRRYVSAGVPCQTRHPRSVQCKSPVLLATPFRQIGR